MPVSVIVVVPFAPVGPPPPPIDAKLVPHSTAMPDMGAPSEFVTSAVIVLVPVDEMDGGCAESATRSEGLSSSQPKLQIRSSRTASVDGRIFPGFRIVLL